MPNIKLTLAYDGTNYCGWQIQPDVPTVQGEVERALSKVLSKKVSVICAGRTDTGVHARGQVINFKTSLSFPLAQLPYALNSILPPDIRIIRACYVSDKFHARHSACYKVYRYFIYNHVYLPPWFKNFAWLVTFPLNCDQMQEAANYLIGRHDFSSFQNQGSPCRTPVRYMEKIKITRKGLWISVFMKADGFLYKMARNITGTLVEVGRGKIPPSEVEVILKSRDRRKAGPTAPPQGLFLWKAGYPSHYYISECSVR